MPLMRMAAQRGFAIVAAIFLVVVLSALGAFMVTFSTVQNVTSVEDIQGSRAYQAARTGAEWGAYQILQNNGGPYATNCRAGATAQALPALAGTLAGFAVNVACAAVSYTEAGNTLWIYQITATATSGTPGQISYVERQLRLRIEK